MFDDKNSFSNSWIITFFQKKFDLFWDCLNLVLNQLGFANGKVLQCGSHSPTAYFWNPLNKCSKHIGHEELSNCLAFLLRVTAHPRWKLIATTHPMLTSLQYFWVGEGTTCLNDWKLETWLPIYTSLLSRTSRSSLGHAYFPRVFIQLGGNSPQWHEPHPNHTLVKEPLPFPQFAKPTKSPVTKQGSEWKWWRVCSRNPVIIIWTRRIMVKVVGYVIGIQLL